MRFCWMLAHFSHFQWLSRVEAFGPVLHFWWNPLEHTLHLTGTVLGHKAAEHLVHFSFELLASARDKPWFKRDFNDGGVGWGGELSGDNDGCEVADGEQWGWQCQTLVERVRTLRDSYGVYKSATRGCEVTNIARWVRAMVSEISTTGADRILANGARFSNSRGMIWKYINWSRWHNNFGNSSVMLRTFAGDRATRIFCMTSLVNR